MDLNDFEAPFSETILARGCDYYELGNIVSLEIMVRNGLQ